MCDREDSDFCLSLFIIQESLYIKILALKPGAETRGCDDSIEFCSKLESLALGVVALQRQNPYFFEGWIDDASDELFYRGVFPGDPIVGDDLCQQDILF